MLYLWQISKVQMAVIILVREAIYLFKVDLKPKYYQQYRTES